MDDEAVIITDYAGMWSDYISKRRRDLSSITIYTRSILIDIADVSRAGSDGLKLADRCLGNPRKSAEEIKDGLILSNVVDIFNENDEPITRDVVNKIEVRFTGVPKLTNIRNIRDSDIGKLIAIEGIVKQSTEENLRLSVGAFQCRSCGNVMVRRQERSANGIQMPYQCGACEKKAFELLPDRSDYEDVQYISIQELHESLESGEEPRSIVVELYGDLVGKINAGDRIIMTGEVFRWSKNDTTQIFKRRMYGSSFKLDQTDYHNIDITDEDIEKISAMSEDKNIYERLVNAVAPSIYGMKLLKLALVLQMFGGVAVDRQYEHLRGDIHVLIIGEPGVAKSQIGRYVTQMSPRGIWTSGKGNSAAGLTASAVRDTIGNGEWMLQAGALVLADRGHVTIDEFDKMNDENRSALHEAMEQQEVTIAKAGIVATLKTRCSVLAIANPKLGRFDNYTTISEQIDLPASLISRFDIVMLLRDEPNEERDSHVANHIFDSRYGKVDGELDIDLVVKYIAYAKQNVFPKPTPKAMERLREYYIETRKRYQDTTALPITARQFEALTRLAEASARVRLADEYTEEDVGRVINIVEASLSEIAKDPATGEVDIDRIVNSVSTSQRGRMVMLRSTIMELANEYRVADWDEIVKTLESKNFPTDRLEETKNAMILSGDIYEPKAGKVRLLK